MKNIREFKEVLSLTQHSPKSPQQLNHLFESDCEIVEMTISKKGKHYFCASTDSLGEEMSIGLYQDPYLWGWLTVMSSVSDLSATGATPLGLLLSTQWKFKTNDSIKRAFYRGANAALKKAGVGLLGGDSGYSADPVMTSSIFGTSPVQPLTRLGARPGDLVVMLETKKLGVGPCIAFRYLLKKDETDFPEKLFRPSPQIQLMPKLRPWVNASIDTSDGLAACLHIIARLNKVGFSLHWQPPLVHSQALHFCKRNQLHPLMLWMSDLGDLQNLLFVAPKNLNKLKRLVPSLTVLGECTDREKEYTVTYDNQTLVLPFQQVSECARDAKAIEDLALGLNDYFWQVKK
jgi:thiamine-monophosphate kinase